MGRRSRPRKEIENDIPPSIPTKSISRSIRAGGFGVSNTFEMPNRSFIPAFVCLMAGKSFHIVIHGFVGLSEAYSLV